MSRGVVATGVSRVGVATEVSRPEPAGLPPALPAVLAPPGALAPGHAAGQVAAFFADFPLGRAGSWGAAERVKEA